MRKNKSNLLFLMVPAVLLSAGISNADTYNPFTGQKATSAKGAQAKPQSVAVPVTPGPKLPTMPMPMPANAYPVSPAAFPGQQSQGQNQERQTSYRVVGSIDGKIAVADPYGAILLMNDGDSLDGCVIDYPSISCGSAMGKPRLNKVRQPSVEQPVQKTVAPPEKPLAPEWFNQSRSRSFVDKEMGVIDVIIEGKDVVAIKASSEHAEQADQLLKRYIKKKETKGSAVYYQLSGLISKGEF